MGSIEGNIYKILANLFYEPSTRTSSSFTSAMERLGGSVIPINEVRYSSVSKGESLPDTVRTLAAYADVIVLRHHETGEAALAMDAAGFEIILIETVGAGQSEVEIARLAGLTMKWNEGARRFEE